MPLPESTQHLINHTRLIGYLFPLLPSDIEVFTFQIDRGVKSPADISMDISKLIQMLGFSPMKFEEGVRLTFTNTTNTTS